MVTNLINIRYLTGFTVSYGVLVCERKGRHTLYLDSRYLAALRKRNTTRLLALRPLEALPKDLLKFREICIESDDLTVGRLRRLKKQLKNKKFIHLSGLIEGLRRVKDSYEKDLIHSSCSIAKKLLLKVPKLLKDGVSEEEVSRRVQILALTLGAEGMAFDTIVAFGKNSSEPHHRSDSTRLRPNMVVQIDLGVMYKGYASDYSRVFLHKIKKDSLKAKSLIALKKAKKRAEEILQPGVTNTELDLVAREVLQSHGFNKEFCHALGHGLGLEVHEAPALSMTAPRTKIQSGEFVTLEPGLYFPGKFGMRIEDTYMVPSSSRA